MVLQLHSNVVKSLFMTSIKCFPRFYSLYTPDYLDLMTPKIPLYPTVSVQIKGYNYPTLENFQRVIHHHAQNLDIDIENSYAMPSKSLKIQRLKDVKKSIKVDYRLELYERNTIINVSSTKFPMFIRLLESTLPEGITMKVQQWNSEVEDLRYIPDKELIDLKVELETMRKK